MTAVFPTFSQGAKPDSNKFQVAINDNTISKEIDGGYTVTRPRTTRRLRHSWKCAYTSLSETDRGILEAFYASVSGGAVTFTWVSPQNGVSYVVRFKGSIAFTFSGAGPANGNGQFWDCSLELQEV